MVIIHPCTYILADIYAIYSIAIPKQNKYILLMITLGMLPSTGCVPYHTVPKTKYFKIEALITRNQKVQLHLLMGLPT